MKTAKKLTTLLLALIMSFSLTNVVLAGQIVPSDAKIIFNGKPVSFSLEESSINHDGKMLIQLRNFYDLLNTDGKGTLEWDGATRGVTMILNGKTLELTIGSRTAYIDGIATEIPDAEPIIYNNRTYIPLRFVSNAFGMPVEWYNDSKTAVIGAPQTDETRLSGDYALKLGLKVEYDGESEAGVYDISGKFELDTEKMFMHFNMNSEMLTERINAECYLSNDIAYMKSVSQYGTDYNFSEISFDELLAAIETELASGLDFDIAALADSNLLKDFSIKLNADGSKTITVNSTVTIDDLAVIIYNTLVEIGEADYYTLADIKSGLETIKEIKPITVNVTLDSMDRVTAISLSTGIKIADEINYGYDYSYSYSYDLDLSLSLSNINYAPAFEAEVPAEFIDEYNKYISGANMRAFESNHRIYVSTVCLYIALNDGTLPTSKQDLEEFMYDSFDDEPEGAKYVIGSDGSVTSTYNGQVLTWQP